MYYVYYVIGKNEHQTMYCKRVHLRTDLNILNVLTKENEYKMIDLKYVSYFEITKVEEYEIKNNI